MTDAEDGAGRGTRALLAGLIAALVLAGMLHAREAAAAEDETELAKKTQNPVADLFFSPAKPGAVIWGVGPTFTIPTATDSKLGSGKFSLGPTAVAP